MKLLSLKMISEKSLLYVFLCLLLVIDANAQSTPASSTSKTTVTTRPTTVKLPPGPVENIEVTRQNESSITLSWDKVDNIPTYYLKYEHNGAKEEFIDRTESEERRITFVVTDLAAGTSYNFIVMTTRGGLNSTETSKETFTWPRNAEDFKVIGQDETSITLQWNKVENDQYVLEYDSKKEIINVSEDPVQKTISNLTNMNEYKFRLISVFENVESSGVNTTGYTAPPNPEGVYSVGQNDTSITLQWKKVGNLIDYILKYNGSEVEVSAEAGKNLVTKTVDDLTPANEYNFTVFAVFQTIRSSGVSNTLVTAPRSAKQFKRVEQNDTSITLQWEKVDDLLEYIISINGSEKPYTAPADQDPVVYKATGLTPATKYTFSLFTIFKDVRSTGANHDAVTAPLDSEDFRAVTQNETSITLQWTKTNSIFSYILQYNGGEIDIDASKHQVTVPGLTNTTNYNFTLFTVFEYAKSSGSRIQAATAPPNTEEVTAAEQKETSITLQWRKVGAILDYRIEYSAHPITVTASPGDETVKQLVPGLTSGTWYDFKVFAVFENINSSGQNFRTATVPSQVASVSVTERSIDKLTLEWKTARRDWDYSVHINGMVFNPDTSTGVVSQDIPSLLPGTKYPFSVITSFAGLKSTAYGSSTVTKIDCAKALWKVTNSSITARIEGLFTKATASNISQSHDSPGGNNVLFTGLYPGATYEVSLEYESNTELLNQCEHKVTIIPPDLVAHCKYSGSGYSVFVGWNKPAGIWTKVEVKVKGETYESTSGDQNIVIDGFQPAKTHEISVTSVSEGIKSTAYVFPCTTDPRGVIAGSFFGVLIFLALVCLAAFVLKKRPDLIRRHKPLIDGKKKSNQPKAIPVEKFPDHFHKLGMDENRGFSEEYESLMPVGTEQTRRDALLPENKPKNRFTNVLPYDWCRVKLTSSDANEMSDYINANYMPGYKSSREYIATQGPLPSTVNDFWRMIWEQRVKGIVMVTNCKESGKIKCEQYWPGDGQSHLYGDLTVTVTSEQKEPNWTLREFRLKHKNYSEERTVKHFHFTAWPDHGVPQGTQYLIEFRGLVRQHINTEGTGAPTVVHCSAGVGRTGTIIALDVMLQQLEKERAVGIKGFVQSMRLSRPHMVQTESQYVFLHQCIMDTQYQREIEDENIYENEMVYKNATALKDFHKGSQV